MKKRSGRKKPKRTKPPRYRGQRRQKLSKTVRELYPPGALDGEASDGEWEETLRQALLPLQTRSGGPRTARPREADPGTSAGSRREQAERLERGWVLSPASGSCLVECDGEVVDCVLPSRLARDQQRNLAVGDEVLFATRGSKRRIRKVLPRRTVLSRPDPHNPRRERVIAANVDVVVQVVSVRSPPLRPSLIDRCLIAIERGGARELLCVNKVDLLGDAAERRRELAAIEPYRRIGVEVLTCSARTGEGIDAVRDRLAGRTAVFVGHSGVGKSSLLNALDPDLRIRTGEVGSRRSRGRHTTTRSRLYRLEGDIRVIDTPGIREFGLFELAATELPAYFPELAAHAARCRFNDCLHVREPGCAVRDAVEEGELQETRYATYLRILESLEGEGEHRR